MLAGADLWKDGSWNSGFLDTVGDESGSIQMNVDGSATPVDFKITAPDDMTYFIHRFVGLIVDTGSFDSGSYGNGLALTNGQILVYHNPVIGERVMTNQYPIKKNVDFAAYCYDITHHSWGSGDEALAWRFTIAKDGATFRLDSGCSLIWRVRDDMTGLVEQTIRVGMVSVPNQYLR